MRWNNDVEENPYTFAASNNITLIAVFASDSDTNSEGIGECVDAKPTVYASGNEIRIQGAAQHSLRVYDVTGRLIAAVPVVNEAEQRIRVSSAGVYLVQIDNAAPQKVAVVAR